MSGIAGSIRFDNGPTDDEMVRQMAHRMRHRGPDGISFWSGDGIALAHLKMQTTSESAEGTQPVLSADGNFTLVLDGRVDNWEELRNRLLDKGARLRNRSDAELVLAAFIEWGTDCLPYIEGDFALVLWEARTHRAICARDRMAQKPFFYHFDGARFLFASELRPVLDAMRKIPHLNEGVVAEMLDNAWISREETLWQDVLRLPPGHAMTIGAKGPHLSRYWFPEEIPLLHHKTDKDYIAHYRETLTDVVRRVSRSHAPVGYDVSGGLDSSSIFATADALTKVHRLPAPNIHGFSLKFEADSDAYELEYAHTVGRHTGRLITEVPPTMAPLSWYRREALHAATVPNFPNGLMHEGTFRTLRARGGRAYLNGVGGDQWLAFGENALAEAVQLKDWDRVWSTLSADARAFGILAIGWGTIRHGAYPLLPAHLRAIVRRAAPIKPEGQEPKTWLSVRLKKALEERRAQAAEDWRKKTKGLRIGLRQRLMTIDSAYLQFCSESLEAMGQSAGIEVRSPFLNRTFVEFCLSLPMAQLRRGATDRFVHRAACADLLPAEVLARESKAEFSAVWVSLREELSALPVPTKNSWLDAGRYEDVQVRADDPEQNRYSWPDGMLLCFFLLNILGEL